MLDLSQSVVHVFRLLYSWKSIGWPCIQLDRDHVHLAVESRWAADLYNEGASTSTSTNV